jgi:hypothetical protein
VKRLPGIIHFSPSGLSLILTEKVKAILLTISALPAATLAVLAIVVVPGLAGAYASDIIFWGVMAFLLVATFVATGTVNYLLIIRGTSAEPRKKWYIYRFYNGTWRLRTNQRIAIVWMEGIIASLIIIHIGFHVTNPYAKINIVQQPYITTVNGGNIFVDKQFNLHVASGSAASSVGYYKSGFLILQNALFGSYPAPSHTANGIIDDIHTLRFDPTKPYLISGDQFSVLYPRNLGVFYNSLLDYRTAHSQQDWENRQRIYLQSALYALDAFSDASQITTTIVPISPRSVALTQVHPGSIASDSLYGILYALDRLEHADHVQTSDAVNQIVSERKKDLSMLLDIYLKNVQDPSTGLVKADIHLASARDGVVRSSSFYDNVVLWKTLELANTLGIRQIPATQLASLKAKIMSTFWQEGVGYFKDDQKSSDFSADWLIAMPTGFMNVTHPDDQAKIEKIIAYTKKKRLDQPFPIRYSLTNDDKDVPFAVKKFVPNYGGNAIWSYWGAQYTYLLGKMYHQTGVSDYKDDAQKFITVYRDKIVQTHGFPETFDTDGNFLQNPVYKSIRQTGWVVEFELAESEVGMFVH